MGRFTEFEKKILSFEAAENKWNKAEINQLRELVISQTRVQYSCLFLDLLPISIKKVFHCSVKDKKPREDEVY